MGRYLRSTWVKVGIGLFVVGAAPLVFIIVAAAVGLLESGTCNLMRSHSSAFDKLALASFVSDRPTLKTSPRMRSKFSIA